MIFTENTLIGERQEMVNKNSHVAGIKPISFIWHRVLQENNIPLDGIIVEVAPGYETKIGDALALLGFKGTILLIEPDPTAAAHISVVYKTILPYAQVKVIVKTLQDVRIGKDIPKKVDVLVANHPFDDMVIAAVLPEEQRSFFSKEREGGIEFSRSVQEMYASLRTEDYLQGVLATIAAWKHFIQELKPFCVIVNQYPSHTLTMKGLTKRQNSGLIIIELLQDFYETYLTEHYHDKSFGQKGDPAWWMVAHKPYIDLSRDLGEVPRAIHRLSKSIFVPQQNGCFLPNETYDVVYIDQHHFKKCGYDADALSQLKHFAITLGNTKTNSRDHVIVFADRQKDVSNIGLNGNLGSGRAVYYGNNYNVMGVGRTTLCTSATPSHATGKIDLVNALRRVVLSRWINYFTDNAVVHPLVIALKECERYKWSQNPVPSALLVRVDNGDLDRPSHIEYAPEIPIKLEEVIHAYAKLDAECFVHRMLLGAWSTGNYSLNGKMIDLETASFVKYRGPYFSASKKYQGNYFGHEGFGLIRILKQLAEATGASTENIEHSFYDKRRECLGRSFLRLLGVTHDAAHAFFARHTKHVLSVADQFEQLAKKTVPTKQVLNVYHKIPDNEDPTLLDMSNLFRNLAELYTGSLSDEREMHALHFLVRNTALAQILSQGENKKFAQVSHELSEGEAFIETHVTVTHSELEVFLSQTREFVSNLFHLLDLLKACGYLPSQSHWRDLLKTINQDFPPLSEINQKLLYWVEEYRTGSINAESLGKEIETLCQLPHYPTGQDFSLLNIPIFEHLSLSKEEQNIFGALLEKIDYKAGELVIREDDIADFALILVQGNCVISANGQEIITIYNRGLFVGEAVVVGDERKRTASITAKTATRFLRISKDNLEAMAVLRPEFKRILVRALDHKRKGIDKKILALEIFNRINPERIRIFLADKGVEKKFKNGDVLIKEGTQSQGVYFLMSGSLQLYQLTRNGHIPLSDTHFTEGIFGEQSTLFDTDAICTVVAREETTALYLNREDFQNMVRLYSHLLPNCLAHIGNYARLNRERALLCSKVEENLE